ncbi:thrombospondin-2-like [Mercenaria mercenaria]|uniref:thrombospondin-2-like n=1 Tax=Mercenaria mercenaria TaxID=6596 RepID=UPI00234E6338|nr:thrombospondin-2-like [Mercenaria mercenaria]
MNKVYFLSVSICTILIITGVETLECYSCSKISDPSTCNTTITCATDEACYQESTVSGHTKIVTLGCINNKQCGASTTDSLTMIGRDIKRRQEQKCLECCGTDRCNEILCAHRNPAACIDDETIDCPRMNSVFGICKDINHAKSLCPDFCKLCDVVDGVWTEWTLWSTCDVTCETGIQSRSRTCANPAPAHGGQDCVGNQAETKLCQKSLCPVHGHWSSWEAWGACSVSCGLGIQRRQRTCTNPAPQRFGDHCFGLNIDDRICVPKACSDGEWTSWGNWSSCSVTCGGGFQSRSRSCTNPRPSLIGRYCDGDSSQVGSCNRHACRGMYKTTRSIAFIQWNRFRYQFAVMILIILGKCRPR